MFSAIIKLILFTNLCIIIGYSNPDDYQVILRHSAINKLVQQLMPILTQEILSLTVPAQTFDGVATIELGEITIRNVSIQNTTVDFDTNTQDIALNIINLGIELNQFTFKATAFGVSFLSCTGTLSPTFANWHLSVTLHTETNDCNISIHLTDSLIQEGTIDLNQQFGSGVCNTLYTTADFLVDIEEKMGTEIVEQIPNMINDELQTAINAYIGQTQGTEGITMCFTNITVYSDHLLIAGDLITPVHQVQAPSNISTTLFIDIENPEDPIYYDDSSLFVFGMMIMILSCLVGCGAGVGIFCGCNQHKIKQVRQSKRTDDKGKVQPLRIDDDTSDEDGHDTNKT